MSLIYGLSLAKKIYLVSDSRLTYTDGSYKDDFSKWLNLNPQLAVVVAGSAHQACWLLREIRKGINKDWDFSELENFLKDSIQSLATRYYSETGDYNDSVGMIFGGFEKSNKLEIDAARLGQIMSSPVIERGEGVNVSQTVDSQIKEALLQTLMKGTREGRTVGEGTLIEVDSPRPRIMAVTINASDRGAEVTFENAGCYDGLVFNPKYKTERIVLPDSLIGNLEFRDKSGETEENTLYKDQGYIIIDALRLLRERKWPTVGGNILCLVMTPDFSGFASGDYMYVPAEGDPIRGGTEVIDGRLHYFDKEGQKHPYRFIYDYLDNSDKKDKGGAAL